MERATAPRLGRAAAVARRALAPCVASLLALASLPAVAAPAAAQQGAGGVQTGVSVSADTVLVGAPFTVSVRVRAPLGDSIVFPAGPDTAGVVQPLDPVSVRSSGDTAAVDRTAVYRLAAWDVGEQRFELGSVRVVSATGAREVRLPTVTLLVQTVLPADTSLRVPKPARAPWAFPRPWWIPWLVGLLALLLLLLVLWWFLRRRRGRVGDVARLDPYAEAEERFAHLDRMRLVEGGERSRHVALALEILRDYLAARVPAASPALTSRELLAALADRREVPHDRLAAVLLEGDLVKFARRDVSDDRAREIGRESREIVGTVEQARRAADAAAAAAAPAAPARGVEDAA